MQSVFDQRYSDAVKQLEQSASLRSRIVFVRNHQTADVWMDFGTSFAFRPKSAAVEKK